MQKEVDRAVRENAQQEHQEEEAEMELPQVISDQIKDIE